MAWLAKHKLAAVATAAAVAYYLYRRRTTTKCKYADSTLVDGVCMRTGTVDPLFDLVDARDAPIGFDDNGSPLVTRPSQL